ncbi:MAG: DUF2189 domain-containing protein [Sphingomonas sp.]
MPAIDAARPSLAAPQIEVRRIGFKDVGWALAEGWRDFRAKRGDLIFAGLLYPVICLIAIVTTVNDPLLPLFFPLVAGVSIAGPAVASGFYELARRREDGEDASWSHFLDPLKGRSRLPLLLLTMMLAALFVGWLLAAYVIYDAIFAGSAPMHISDALPRLIGSSEGVSLIVIGNLVGLGFAIVTLVTSWLSFPMVVDKPVDALTAVETSLRAARVNLATLTGWGLCVALLLLVGTIPLGIGLAVVLPWLGYATWHLYTRVVAR